MDKNTNNKNDTRNNGFSFNDNIIFNLIKNVAITGIFAFSVKCVLDSVKCVLDILCCSRILIEKAMSIFRLHIGDADDESSSSTFCSSLVVDQTSPVGTSQEISDDSDVDQNLIGESQQEEQDSLN